MRPESKAAPKKAGASNTAATSGKAMSTSAATSRLVPAPHSRATASAKAPAKMSTAAKPAVETKPAAEKSLATLQAEEAERKARALLSQYDEDKDEALNLRELARLIKDENEEIGFCEENLVGAYIKEQLRQGDRDGDTKLNAAEFVAWYPSFEMHVNAYKEKKKESERQKEAAAAQIRKTFKAQFEGIGMWRCTMEQLPDTMDEAIERGRTPMIIDSTGDGTGHTPLETFYSYAKGVEILEMKKMVVDVNMKKDKTREDALKEARAKLLYAMKHGKNLTVLLSNSAPPLTSQFSDPALFPLDIFNAAEVRNVQGKKYNEWGDCWASRLLNENDQIALIHEQFRVSVVTRFSEDDYEDFLKDEFPMSLFQAIQVKTSS